MNSHENAQINALLLENQHLKDEIKRLRRLLELKSIARQSAPAARPDTSITKFSGSEIKLPPIFLYSEVEQMSLLHDGRAKPANLDTHQSASMNGKVTFAVNRVD